jgi:hypothetical protein
MAKDPVIRTPEIFRMLGREVFLLWANILFFFCFFFFIFFIYFFFIFFLKPQIFLGIEQAHKHGLYTLWDTHGEYHFSVDGKDPRQDKPGRLSEFYHPRFILGSSLNSAREDVLLYSEHLHAAREFHKIIPEQRNSAPRRRTVDELVESANPPPTNSLACRDEDFETAVIVLARLLEYMAPGNDAFVQKTGEHLDNLDIETCKSFFCDNYDPEPFADKPPAAAASSSCDADSGVPLPK